MKMLLRLTAVLVLGIAPLALAAKQAESILLRNVQLIDPATDAVPDPLANTLADAESDTFADAESDADGARDLFEIARDRLLELLALLAGLREAGVEGGVPGAEPDLDSRH